MREGSRSMRVFILFACTFALLLGSAPVAGQSNADFTAAPLSPASTYSSRIVKDAPLRTTSAAGDLISVLVKLDVEPVAAYTGGIAGLPATSPRATGQRKLNPNADHVRRYRALVNQKQRDFAAAAQAAVPAAQITGNYDVVYGGVAMVVPRDQLGVIARLPGVLGIQADELVQLTTETSPGFIGAPTAWAQQGGQANAGAGVIVGILDSGVWPEHPSFADPDPLGRPYAPPPVGAPLACEFGSAIPGDAPFACNNKLIGAHRFMDTYDLFGPALYPGEFLSARDDNGHGTHTATTAAGNAGVAASIFGVARGVVSGIAPRAHVVAYKVCGDAGCYQSDSVNAINQAILDGVDVINFSISGGNNPYSDAVELAFLNAYAAGVFVAASAGNSGPTAETVAHRGPWVTTVGASTSDRHFLSTLTLTADNGDTLELVGATITSGVATPTPVVFAGGDRQCLAGMPPVQPAGAMVICDRGIIARVTKGFNAQAAGAGSMILRNLVPQGLNTDNHYLPSVHLDAAEGATLEAFMNSHTGVMATFTPGTAQTVAGDVMASFSSRGGPAQSLGISKPDVTAPGVQILAGHTPAPATAAIGVGGPAGELFQAIQGTSMSSPHVAGAAAMIRAIHPNWTPGQIKSALMTTAQTSGLVKEDGETPFTPFDAGSGRIDLTDAWDPGITFDVQPGDYLAYRDALWHVNYPSVYIPVMAGVATVRRTAQSVLPHQSAWQIKVVDAPDDIQVSVPASILIPAGGSASFDITIDARNVPLNAVRSATIQLKHGYRTATIPVTIVRKQAALTLSHSCDPTDLGRNALAGCLVTMSNTTFDSASVAMQAVIPHALTLVGGSVVNGPQRGNRATFAGVLQGAAPPDVTAVPGPTFGYLPLAGFGIAPLAGVGDETITNFNIAPYTYAGRTYTSIGMVSNGYLVVGGGTGADVDFINTNLPDPARPNNVIAPFWTDLNPAFGGAMRVATLSSGANSWTVFEWTGVVNYGDRRPNTFQAWIPNANNSGTLAGLPANQIWMTYGAVSNGDGGYLTIGAENEFGNRGQAIYFDGVGIIPSASGAIVGSVPGAPGETRQVGYSVRGSLPQSWTTCAEMTSNIFFGVSTACVSGSVAPQ